MAGRTIISYFDVERARWCTPDTTPIFERHYPEFNLYETPVLVIKLLDKTGDPIIINFGSTFELTITDTNYNPIALPSSNGVNNEDDFEDVDPLNGVFSFRLDFATFEAEALLAMFRSRQVYVNLNIIDPITSYNTNMSAVSRINKVYKSDSRVTPISNTSQFRLNATDGGIDIWDYTTNSWKRPVLQDGVLNYYDAP